MTTSSLRNAIYRLGQISSDETLTNDALLERLVDLLSEALEVDIVAMGVFEEGLDASSSACVVRGPWTGSQPTQASDNVFWAIEDRSVAQRLAQLKRGRLHHNPGIAEDAEAEEQKTVSSSDDTAIALFKRSDGIELVIGINAAPGSGEINRAVLQKAGALVPFVARCWADCWKIEPAWMAAFKPQAKGILALVLQGLDDDQIAEKTGLSYHSVRAHLKRMFREADVRSRLHLMQACREISRGGVIIEGRELETELADPPEIEVAVRANGSSHRQPVA